MKIFYALGCEEHNCDPRQFEPSNRHYRLSREFETGYQENVRLFMLPPARIMSY